MKLLLLICAVIYSLCFLSQKSYAGSCSNEEEKIFKKALEEAGIPPGPEHECKTKTGFKLRKVGDGYMSDLKYDRVIKYNIPNDHTSRHICLPQWCACLTKVSKSSDDGSVCSQELIAPAPDAQDLEKAEILYSAMVSYGQQSSFYANSKSSIPLKGKNIAFCAGWCTDKSCDNRLPEKGSEDSKKICKDPVSAFFSLNTSGLEKYELNNVDFDKWYKFTTSGGSNNSKSNQGAK